MPSDRFKRFRRIFDSVFTKLLATILIAGAAITLTVIIGFMSIRFHSISAIDRNADLYAEYLAADIGNPPQLSRAEAVARRTGMVIRYRHPHGSWQTGAVKKAFDQGHKWEHRPRPGLTIGFFRGNHYFKLDHAQGEILFVINRKVVHDAKAGWILTAMAIIMSGILGLCYFYIRRLLRPVRRLKTGADQFGAGLLDYRVPETGNDEFRDLAEAFNRMAQRLSGLLKSKEQLLLDVSHELRSPLTRMRVGIEFVTDPEAKQSLQDDIDEMGALISTILEEARMRKTADALNLAAVDIAELIRSLADDFKDCPPGVVCHVPDKCKIRADQAKIRILLRNLLENGIKHTPDDGEPVSISLSHGENTLVIIVKDKGEGIAEADQPFIFEPFFRTDASRSRKTGGYGLGLSLCKAIADSHNGRIEITSAPGCGVQAKVILQFGM